MWHRTAAGGNLEAFELLWRWANKVEIKTDELLLAQTGDGYTAFQLAAENNHIETFRNSRSGLKKRNSIQMSHRRICY